METPDQLRDILLQEAADADTLGALEALRVSALGKKGRITDLMKGLGQMDPDARKSAGQALNALKDEVAAAIDAKKTTLADADLNRRLMTEKIDVTLPTGAQAEGYVHPISQTIDEIIAIFGEMGFTVAEGPDIEDDWHNFTALNIPPDHPARQEHDTFYLPGEHGERKVLRTHTSPTQIRTMTAHKPPIARAISRSPNPLPRSISVAPAKAAGFGSVTATIGWRFWAQAWSTRMCCVTAASTPKNTRALPSAWALSGSRC